MNKELKLIDINDVNGRKVYTRLVISVLKRAVTDASRKDDKGNDVTISNPINLDAKVFIKHLENSYLCDFLGLNAINIANIKNAAGVTNWEYIPESPKEKKHNYPVVRWYTDGVVNVRRKSCPEGFYLGKSGNHGNQYTVKKEAEK